MKIIKSFFVLLFGASIISCGNSVKTNATSLDTELDSVSYAVGISMAKQVEFNFKEVNVDLFIQGFINSRDSSSKLLIEEKDMKNILSKYFQKQQEKALKELREKEKKKNAEIAENKKLGLEFLEANKTKKGVITTKSGLQYKILKEGKGRRITPTDSIKIHYHGTDIKGKVFDSTVDRNKPYISEASIFVAGFSEALYLMNEGAKYKIFIPAALGYGENSIPNKVPPYSTLIFELEVLEILN